MLIYALRIKLWFNLHYIERRLRQLLNECPIVDPSEPIDYLKLGKYPKSYKCSTCGASGLKLWCYYNTPFSGQKLFCAECAGKDQKKGVRSMNAEGCRVSRSRNNPKDSTRTNQIGWRVPAIPTEKNDGIWGYPYHGPFEGIAWWRALPSLPAKKAS